MTSDIHRDQIKREAGEENIWTMPINRIRSLTQLLPEEPNRCTPLFNSLQAIQGWCPAHEDTMPDMPTGKADGSGLEKHTDVCFIEGRAPLPGKAQWQRHRQGLQQRDVQKPAAIQAITEIQTDVRLLKPLRTPTNPYKCTPNLPYSLSWIAYERT